MIVFCTTICTVSPLVILWTTSQQLVEQHHKKRETSSESQTFQLWNLQPWMASGRLWFSASLLFWQQMTWRESASHDARADHIARPLFYLAFFPFFLIFSTTSDNKIQRRFEGETKLCFVTHAERNFLSTELIAKCVVADLEAKEPLLVVAA